MAIDPSIALQAQGPNFNTAQTALQAAEAGNVMVDAMQKSRQLAAQKWLGANADQWTTIDPKTGQMNVDYGKMVNNAAANGFGDAVPEIAQSFNTTIHGQLANATTAQDLAAKKYDLATQGSVVTAQKMQQALKSGDMQTAQDLYNRTNQFLSQYGGQDAVDQMGTPANQAFSPDVALNWSRQRINSSMTPKEQTTLNQSQQQIDVSKAQLATNGVQNGINAVDANNKAAIYNNAVGVIQSTSPSTLAGLTPSNAGTIFGIRKPQVDAAIGAYNKEHGTTYDYSAGPQTLIKILKQEGAVQAAKGFDYGKAAKITGMGSPANTYPQTPSQSNLSSMGNALPSGVTPDANGNVKVRQLSTGQTGSIPAQAFDPSRYQVIQ
jgi:hypothetical protein